MSRRTGLWRTEAQTVESHEVDVIQDDKRGWRHLASNLVASRVAWSTILRALAVLAGIAQSIVVARVGGPDLRGVGATFAALSALAFQAVWFDISAQAVREIRDGGNPAQIRGYLSRIWTVYLVMALPLLAVSILGEPSLAFLIVGTLTYFAGTSATVAAAAFRGPVLQATAALVQQVGFTASVVAFAAANSLNDTTIKLSVIIGYLAPLVIVLPSLPRRRKDFPDPPFSCVKRLLWKGSHWQVSNIFCMALTQGGVILVSWKAGAGQAGIYATASTLAMLPMIVGQTYSQETYFRANVEGRSQHRIDATRSVVVSGLAAIGIALVAKPLISVAYGPAFDQAFLVTLFLLPGAVAWCGFLVGHQLVRVYGRPIQPVLYCGAGLCLMVILSLCLAIPSGTDSTAVEVAVGVSAAQVLTAVAAALTASRDRAVREGVPRAQ